MLIDKKNMLLSFEGVNGVMGQADYVINLTGLTSLDFENFVVSRLIIFTRKCRENIVFWKKFDSSALRYWYFGVARTVLCALISWGRPYD